MVDNYNGRFGGDNTMKVSRVSVNSLRSLHGGDMFNKLCKLHFIKFSYFVKEYNRVSYTQGFLRKLKATKYRVEL